MRRIYLVDMIENTFGVSRTEALVIMFSFAFVMLLATLIPILHRSYVKASPEKRKSQRRLYWIIAGSVTAAAIAGICIWHYTAVTVPARRAEALVAEGDFRGAIAIYRKLGDEEGVERVIAAREADSVFRAQEALDAGDVSEAAELLQGRISEPAAARVALSSPALQDELLTFNTYLDFGTYGDRELRWRVLDRSGNKVLLLASDFDFRVRVGRDDTGWEDSYVRERLNQFLIDRIFSEEEQSAIQLTRVSSERLEDGKVVPAPDTEDRFFLLSVEEIEHYHLSDYKELWGNTCMLTRTVRISEGALLVSRGSGVNVMTSASGYGYIEDKPGSEHNIRPAMWVDFPRLLAVWARQEL